MSDLVLAGKDRWTPARYETLAVVRCDGIAQPRNWETSTIESNEPAVDGHFCAAVDGHCCVALYRNASSSYQDGAGRSFQPNAGIRDFDSEQAVWTAKRPAKLARVTFITFVTLDALWALWPLRSCRPLRPGLAGWTYWTLWSNRS